MGTTNISSHLGVTRKWSSSNVPRCRGDMLVPRRVPGLPIWSHKLDGFRLDPIPLDCKHKIFQRFKGVTWWTPISTWTKSGILSRWQERSAAFHVFQHFSTTKSKENFIYVHLVSKKKLDLKWVSVPWSMWYPACTNQFLDMPIEIVVVRWMFAGQLPRSSHVFLSNVMWFF